MLNLSLFRRPTIGGRLITGFALVGGVLAVAVGATIWTVDNVSATFDRMTSLRVPVAITSTEIVSDIVTTLATLRGYLLTGNEQGKSERAVVWRDLDRDAARLDEMAAQFTNAENQQKWSEAKALLGEFRSAQDKAESVAFTAEAFPATKLLGTEAAPRVGTMFSEITKMINEEEGLEATPERKRLLKSMADVRGNLAASAAQLRMFLLSGEKANKDEFLRISDVFKRALQSVTEQRELLTPSQSTSFDAVLKAFEGYEPLPAQIIAMRESPEWNRPVHILATEAAPRAGKILDLMIGAKQADGTRSGGLKDNQQQMLAVDSEAAARGMSFLATLEWVLLAVGLGGAGLIAFLTRNSIVRPIRGMTDTMGTLANGDTTVEIPGTGRSDEIGGMASAVQVFKDNMIRTRELEAEAAAQKARSEAERKKMMLELADGFEKAVGAVVNSVSDAAMELQSAAQSLSASSAETSTQSTVVAAASEQAAVNVRGVATAAEELSGSVREISRQVDQSTRIAEKAAEEARQTTSQVAELSQGAKKIGTIVDLINNIARQTNLLALNATIEAARAGEAGKGFSVVAQEVKALADQTTKATAEIASQISTVQASTEQAANSILVISQTVGEINGIATAIASAVTEQGAATEEIARNVHEAAKGTTEVTSNISGVSQAAESSSAASHQVLSSATDLSQQSEKLRSEVGRFLATVRAA
jgi:methyl-accepting chemotaxis protein